MNANITQTNSRTPAPGADPAAPGAEASPVTAGSSPVTTGPARSGGSQPDPPAITVRPVPQPPPDASRRPRITHAGTRPLPPAAAADVVLAYLRVHAATLVSLEPMARADEPDAVHQMRVAARRLRATLRSFGEVIPRSATAHLDAELRWLGALLGQVRDGEVLPSQLHASLRPVPAELVIGPVHARVQGHFSPRHAAGLAELVAALDSGRFAALLAALDRLTLDPPRGPRAGDPAADVLPAAVRRAYRQAHRRMRGARHAPAGPARDAALHSARKSARRARYAAEAAAPAIGGKARRFSRQMKKVQSVLGEHQDSVLARHAARDLGIGAHLSGENAFSYGLLHELEHHKAELLQVQARRVWRHASRSRYRQWM
jgi:CHAD domain-containing protein